MPRLTLPPMPRHPDADEFARRAAAAQVVPVYRQLLADRLTPVSAFDAIGRHRPHSFLLESVVGGEKVGRYSFIATDPAVVYACKDGTATTTTPSDDAATTTRPTADPLADLAALLGDRAYAADPKLPGFTGGLVGYAGYDTVRYYEPDKLKNAPHDDRRLPDLLFGLYRELVVFDHVDKTIKVVANAEVGSGKLEVGSAYADGCRRVDTLVDALSAGLTRGDVGEIDPAGPAPLAFDANLSRNEYEAAVAAGIEYIRAGDIFQFVPSMRLRVRSDADPFDVYRALRVINPSPFMFYLRTPGCTLIGSSPEILCRVEGGRVHSRPLAGTRPRGADEASDAANEADLRADPKEVAEHVMLVDLHRNDVGRVAEAGSVTLSEPLSVERYSHVMHLTTHVTGTLSPGLSALDALRVSLPVGTVSGAPKVRAMQIIDELEPTRRGPYGGAVGYADFAGDLDTCIALRTIVHTADDRGGVYDVQAGAGVVADSVPASEYAECMSKAQALLRAVAVAETL